MPTRGDGPPIEEPAGDITHLLRAWSGGDPAALDRLAERVYPELRRMARRGIKEAVARQRRNLQIQMVAGVGEIAVRNPSKSLRVRGLRERILVAGARNGHYLQLWRLSP